MSPRRTSTRQKCLQSAKEKDNISKTAPFLTQSLPPKPKSQEDIQKDVCNAMKEYPKLWKTTVTAVPLRRKETDEIWQKVAEKSGYSVYQCKNYVKNVKASLKRRITKAVEKGAKSWPEVEKCVNEDFEANQRLSSGLWVGLPWLAKELTEDTLKQRGIIGQNFSEEQEHPVAEGQQYELDPEGSTGGLVIDEDNVDEENSPDEDEGKIANSRKKKGQWRKRLMSKDDDQLPIKKRKSADSSDIAGEEKSSLVDAKSIIGILEQDYMAAIKNLKEDDVAELDLGVEKNVGSVGGDHMGTNNDESGAVGGQQGNNGNHQHPDLTTYGQAWAEDSFIKGLGRVDGEKVKMILEALIMSLEA